jgi:hypothetical protein
MKPVIKANSHALSPELKGRLKERTPISWNSGKRSRAKGGSGSLLQRASVTSGTASRVARRYLNICLEVES